MAFDRGAARAGVQADLLVDRVQLPAFRVSAGFGPGVIYMAVHDSTGAVHLERTRVR